MNTCIKLGTALAPILVASGIAHAGCTVPSFEFHPELNDKIVVDAVMARNTTCEHRLGEGPGYRLTAKSIARKPEHGSASLSGDGRVQYRPAPAFSGKDFYEVKICARKDSGGSGCSNIFVVITVQ